MIKYLIENYFATKLYNVAVELEEVVDGYGIVESEDIVHVNGFLVYNTELKKVENVYFNPCCFEDWNGKEVFVNEEKKKEQEGYDMLRKMRIASTPIQEDIEDTRVEPFKSFSSLKCYSPGLSDEEIEEEMKKDIYIPVNRLGVEGV